MFMGKSRSIQEDIKMTNPTIEVQRYGQSLWYDNLSRDMIASGELQRLIDTFGVLGVTTNPAIFEKAIKDSQLYDTTIAGLSNLSAGNIFETLAVQDVQQAADLFRPIYERTQGIDGYVSLEVSPLLAQDGESTLQEAKRLFAAVDRPNIMIKIPGTAAGLGAIEEALVAGINVNITLLFAVENYVQVATAYIHALERRHDAGLPVDRLASVASFFVSRIDNVADKLLPENHPLQGKIAIANAKIAYDCFRELFYGNGDYGRRFAKLREAGARVQRPLWASTGTKNPAYPDVLYVDALIGPDTVNTVPPATLAAFKDHGTAAPTLDRSLEDARRVMAALPTMDIDLSAITARLQDEGVAAFVNSFRGLLAEIEKKQQQMQSA
jgi:transaldolase